MAKAFDISKFRKSITKSIDGLSIGFNDPTDWVSTNNFALNYLISGDFTRGVPLGKVTVFAGESGAGKTEAAKRVMQYISAVTGSSPQIEHVKRVILDSNPVQSEPLPGLQGQANTFGSDAALKLINHLPSPAYVKVVNGSGATVATVYLRTQESYQLEIPAGSYQVKYASGSASQWRGPLYYFGSSTSFHKGDFTDIPTNQILSLTFYQIVTKGYASGGTPTISAEEFER
jgi:hypothetical protein